MRHRQPFGSSVQSSLDKDSCWIFCIWDPVVRQLLHDISVLACCPLHFVQVRVIALYTLVNLSPSNNYDVIQNKIQLLEEEGEGGYTCACIHASSTQVFVMWIIFKRSSDRSWRGKGRKLCLFVSGWVSFPTTFSPPYLTLMRPHVSDLKLHPALLECPSNFGWTMHFKKVSHIATWEYPNYQFLVCDKACVCTAPPNPNGL